MGDLGIRAPPETFNPLPRDSLALLGKVFHKYLLSDYDGPERSLALAWGWH